MRAVLIFALLILGGPAYGYFDTGNSLLERCSRTDNFHKGACTGTVSGAFDMMLAWGWKCGSSLDGVTREQVKDIVVKYFVDNPGTRHDPAAFHIVLAIANTFRCEQPK